MDSSEEPKWKIFEKLVAGVQKELAPNATIKHDDQIWGQDSDTYRQVDISIRNKVGQFDLLIGIDCKDYKRPVDIGEVEAFGSKIKDIRANKGAIVASNGFTSGAINLGKNCGIDLYRLIDAEAHDWQTYISIPVLCDFRSIDQYHFAIPDYFGSQDPYKIMLHDTNEHQLGNLVEMLVKRWNAGKVSTEPGRSGWINLTDNHEKVEVSGKFREVHVEAEIVVRSRLYFGQLKLIDIKGFRNEISGAITTNEFTTDWLDTKRVEREWRELSSAKELAVIPVLKLEASDVYNIPLEPKDFTKA